VAEYVTRFGSLDDYEKGGVEVINDDPRNYAFSNVFEVASQAKPWEKVAVGKNMEYVLEVIRAEGTSPWRTADHDEFALVMDGEVRVELVKLDAPVAPEGKPGSVELDREPQGTPMGRITARHRHQVLLPAHAAYRIVTEQLAVILLQTIRGDDTVERWSQICQTFSR
jgi:hypothetical protein